MGSSTYRVDIGAFQGPFDLLLHLAARRQLDLADLPLAQITDDFLAVLRQGPTVDLEGASEFLVVAATLLELKAARLLPDLDDPEVDQLALEARDLLYARLLDYRTFQQAASWIARELAANEVFHARRAPLEGRFQALRPPLALPLDAAALAALAARLLAERPAPVVDLSHVTPVRLTVREAAALVLDELGRADGGRATFDQLTAGCRHRLDVVAHFLALLELYKLDLLDLDQDGPRGELTLTLKPCPDPEAIAVLQAAVPAAVPV